MRIICGYGGVGKTTFSALMKDKGYLVVDLDSGGYSKHPKWPRNYFDVLRQMESVPGYANAYVLVSTHKEFLSLLEEAQMYHLVIGPEEKTDWLTWKERYVSRPNPEGYIELMQANYKTHYQDMVEHGRTSTYGSYIGLDGKTYLADIFDIIQAWFDKHQQALPQ